MDIRGGFFRQTENFFDPCINVKGKPYSSYRYEQILKEMLLISILSKGATTMEEVDKMPIPDRKVVLNTLRQVEEDRKRKIEEIKEAQKYNNLRNKK
jgi:hypothetical protein